VIFYVGVRSEKLPRRRRKGGRWYIKHCLTSIYISFLSFFLQDFTISWLKLHYEDVRFVGFLLNAIFYFYFRVCYVMLWNSKVPISFMGLRKGRGGEGRERRREKLVVPACLDIRSIVNLSYQLLFTNYCRLRFYH